MYEVRGSQCYSHMLSKKYLEVLKNILLLLAWNITLAHLWSGLSSEVRCDYAGS